MTSFPDGDVMVISSLAPCTAKRKCRICLPSQYDVTARCCGTDMLLKAIGNHSYHRRHGNQLLGYLSNCELSPLPLVVVTIISWIPLPLVTDGRFFYSLLLSRRRLVTAAWQQLLGNGFQVTDCKYVQVLRIEGGLFGKLRSTRLVEISLLKRQI